MCVCPVLTRGSFGAFTFIFIDIVLASPSVLAGLRFTLVNVVLAPGSAVPARALTGVPYKRVVDGLGTATLLTGFLFTFFLLLTFWRSCGCLGN